MACMLLPAVSAAAVGSRLEHPIPANSPSLAGVAGSSSSAQKRLLSPPSHKRHLAMRMGFEKQRLLLGFHFPGIKAAQSCLYCSPFSLSRFHIPLQAMRAAFELASVPLRSSCLGIRGEQPWCQKPQSLVLALEQSNRCFYMCIAFVWEERQVLGHPDPKAQGREGQQHAVGMC